MSDNEPEKGKKKFKMPNTYVILFGRSEERRVGKECRSRR